MMVGAVMYPLGNERWTVGVHYKVVMGFYPENGQIGGWMGRVGRGGNFERLDTCARIEAEGIVSSRFSGNCS